MKMTQLALVGLVIGLGTAVTIGGPPQVNDRAADATARSVQVDPVQKQGEIGANPLLETPKPGLAPRKLAPKAARVTKPARHHGRLMVKFGDALRARPMPDGRVVSFTNYDMPEVAQLRAQFNLRFEVAVPHDEEKIESIRQQAEEYSGRMQPDLKSLMYVYGDEASLAAAAQMLHNLPYVEFVVWDEDERPVGGIPSVGGCCFTDGSCTITLEDNCEDNLGGTYLGDGTTCATCVAEGACCLPGDVCDFMTEADCGAAMGVWAGPGVECTDTLCVVSACCIPNEDACAAMTELECLADFGGQYVPDEADCVNDDGDDICEDVDFECGGEFAPDCFTYPPIPQGPYCNVEACCDLVCDGDPFCCDEQGGSWDEFCVAQANLVCSLADGADRCNTPLNESCFEEHFLGGCFNNECCNQVIEELPVCEFIWLEACVELAFDICVVPGDDAETPDYTSIQGYLNESPYNLADMPVELIPFIPAGQAGNFFSGYNGQGFDLFTPGEAFEDDNGNGWWDVGENWTDSNGDGTWQEPAGLWPLGNELFGKYEVDAYGEGALTQGKTIKVAVLEWGFWTQHEDLDVIVEPGQTVIEIPEITSTDHATACLGIINAIENGFGMTGIAPDAQAYFFPLTSVEEGPREAAAWTSAIDELGPGDVISNSWGPGGGLNNTQPGWMFTRLAADSGITVCNAATNACENMSETAQDLTDSGGIVVGAVSPGNPWYRLTFSNYYEGQGGLDEIVERSNVVHVAGWGILVAAPGYGDVQLPLLNTGEGGDFARSYTSGFNGTSAATPQIAGVVACLQGLAKQFYGIPVPPETVRAALMSSCRQLPVNRTNLNGGFLEDFGCSFDVDPDDGPHRVGGVPVSEVLNGGFPVLAGEFGSASSYMLNQPPAGFDESPLVQNIYVLYGEHLFGNKFSVKAQDGATFTVESRFKTSGVGATVQSPTSPGLNSQVTTLVEDAASDAGYIATGQWADVIVSAKSEVPFPTGIETEVAVQFPGTLVFLQTQLYNWRTRNWDFHSFLPIAESGEEGAPVMDVAETGFGTSAYVNRNADNLILLRLSTFGFGGVSEGGLSIGGGPLTYQFPIDWVNIAVTGGGYQQ